MIAARKRLQRRSRAPWLPGHRQTEGLLLTCWLLSITSTHACHEGCWTMIDRPKGTRARTITAGSGVYIYSRTKPPQCACYIPARRRAAPTRDPCPCRVRQSERKCGQLHSTEAAGRRLAVAGLPAGCADCSRRHDSGDGRRGTRQSIFRCNWCSVCCPRHCFQIMWLW